MMLVKFFVQVAAAAATQSEAKDSTKAPDTSTQATGST